MYQANAPAVVQWKPEDLFVGTAPSQTSIMIDPDSNRKTAPSPMDLLLLALGSCTGVDVMSILKKKRQQVTDYRIELRGKRRDEHPKSYRLIEVHHVITGLKLSRIAVAQAIQLSDEKYCSVAATLRPSAEIISSFEIIEAPVV